MQYIGLKTNYISPWKCYTFIPESINRRVTDCWYSVISSSLCFSITLSWTFSLVCLFKLSCKYEYCVNIDWQMKEYWRKIKRTRYRVIRHKFYIYFISSIKAIKCMWWEQSFHFIVQKLLGKKNIYIYIFKQLTHIPVLDDSDPPIR